LAAAVGCSYRAEPFADAVPLLVRALSDEHPQVRRLAATALGTSGDAAAVEPLCAALLNDDSVGIRRTPGYALSASASSLRRMQPGTVRREQTRSLARRAIFV
jgi:HEAT repeat protein